MGHAFSRGGPLGQAFLIPKPEITEKNLLDQKGKVRLCIGWKRLHLCIAPLRQLAFLTKTVSDLGLARCAS